MNYTILDCYTDEPAGLGVPPYLGTYPRYIYGMLKSKGFTPEYITIDDLRLNVYYKSGKELPKNQKTNIRIYNTTRDITKILSGTDQMIIVLGVHVPGKYLSAIPGTIIEVASLLKGFSFRKVLTGPAVFGTRLEGGKSSERISGHFDEVKHYTFEFSKLQQYAIPGAGIVRQIIQPRIIEIEAGRGCNIGRCSFCTEPLKNRFASRKTEDILEEVKAFYSLGCRFFRIGKQSDFYSIEDPIGLLRRIREECPDIKVLHIDNVNPVFVVAEGGVEKTKAIVRYCSEGNVAAFGIESFDPVVAKANMLNCSRATAMRAIRIINEYGSECGDNGMPKFLPGINLIFGLGEESRKTHEYNMNALMEIYEKGWMLRRINIRQASILPNTLFEKKFGSRYLKKNKRYYWKWRNEIRQKIDLPMLRRLLPEGSILKDVYSEIYDGKTTFGRQISTYPLIVGIEKRIPLRKFYKIRVRDHMLRSVVGEVV